LSEKRESPYSSSLSSTPASIRSRDIFVSPSARRKHPSENIILNCCGQAKRTKILILEL